MDLIVDLLSVGTKWKLFQFNRALYEQTDEVAMGSPLGPLLANVLMSSSEENFEQEGKLPSFYWRYVNNMLTMTLNIAIASNFLDTLNKKGTFLCKIYDGNQYYCNGMLPFLDFQLQRRLPQVETKVYIKPTNSGLLQHYQSHVGNRFKRGLLRTIIVNN